MFFHLLKDWCPQFNSLTIGWYTSQRVVLFWKNLFWSECIFNHYCTAALMRLVIVSLILCFISRVITICFRYITFLSIRAIFTLGVFFHHVIWRFVEEKLHSKKSVFFSLILPYFPLKFRASVNSWSISLNFVVLLLNNLFSFCLKFYTKS